MTPKPPTIKFLHVWFLEALTQKKKVTSQHILNLYKDRYHKVKHDPENPKKYIELQSQNIYSNLDHLIQEGIVIETAVEDKDTKKPKKFYKLAEDGCYGGKLIFRMKGDRLMFCICGKFDICRCPVNGLRRDIGKDCIYHDLYVKFRDSKGGFEIRF